MKFVKIAAVASVAAMVAGGAFANAGQSAIEGAINDIQAAYTAVNGTVSTGAAANIADLMYFLDNNGAVSSVSYDGAGIDADTGDFVQGTLTIDTYDYASDIEDSKAAVVGSIQTDMFGSVGATAADVVIGEAADVWALTGVTGFAADYISGGLVASLNSLENAIDLAETANFDAASLNGIKLAAEAAETAGADVDTKVSGIEGAYGSKTDMLASTRLRDTSEGEVTLTAGGESHVERAHVNLSGYTSIVDAALSN